MDIDESKEGPEDHLGDMPGFDPDTITTMVVGHLGMPEYRRFFSADDRGFISPWHDVPLHTDDGTPHEKWMVAEIPKMTSAKFEIHTEERYNPIAQDIKNGNLRHYHQPIFWNYGYLPQTWEDPHEVHPELKVKGDNDPLDVVEIGHEPQKQGQVTRVKVLGALAMIDVGELDWKIIAVDVRDPMAANVSDIADLEREHPHMVSGIREWFRWYKVPDGQLNEFGFEGRPLNRDEAVNVVEETHQAWQRLRHGKVDATGLWLRDAPDAKHVPHAEHAGLS